jgi:2-oxoglutarate/2-oxoacid ferredoxin oxidoreductase subunit alpha
MGERYNILFGGAAGLGPNILTRILGRGLVKLGYNVFYTRDYQSLIRGGHNFNVLTFSKAPVNSNDSKMDMIIALDELTEKTHKKDLKKGGVILKGHKENMYYAGRMFKLLGMKFSILDEILRSLKKRYDENVKNAAKGYEEEKGLLIQTSQQKKTGIFMDGNKGISTGAVDSGLDVYIAYPMTPSTPILGQLAKKQVEKNYLVLEIENEIAVANAGVGAAMTGAKTMIGSSGGGIDLMGETISLMGIAEIPLVVYLAQRPGPGSGVPTYNVQGDLQMARHIGHGEFDRLVVAPGDPKDAMELTNQCFYFSQKYQMPCMLVGDKHLGESVYTIPGKGKIVKVPKVTKLRRYNSYEQDPITGSGTEDGKIIKTNIEKRAKKFPMLAKEAKSKFQMYEVFGKKDSKNVVLFWGSTKGAVVDAIQDLNCKAIQIKYIEPFPKHILKELQGKGKKVFLVENNSTGFLKDILMEKTGFEIPDKNKILRYDSRPFLRDQLNAELKKRIK